MFEQIFVTPRSPFRSRMGTVLVVASAVGLLAQAAILIFDLPKPWRLVPVAAWCVVLGMHFIQQRNRRNTKNAG
ncbi:MAG: hypothetical protein ACRD4E_12570 [Bryobacteraceae bacterium]